MSTRRRRRTLCRALELAQMERRRVERIRQLVREARHHARPGRDLPGGGKELRGVHLAGAGLQALAEAVDRGRQQSQLVLPLDRQAVPELALAKALEAG